MVVRPFVIAGAGARAMAACALATAFVDANDSPEHWAGSGGLPGMARENGVRRHAPAVVVIIVRSAACGGTQSRRECHG